MTLLKSKKIHIGWSPKNFRLQATDEKNHSLSVYKDKKGLLMAFSCNHCPYAKASWPLLIELYHKHKDNIYFIAINPNDPIQFPDDSFEEMKKKVQKWDIPFPYLFDETQEVAKSYQAQCTPDIYLFKNKKNTLKLFYHGRINDNWQHPEFVKEKNLHNAIEKLIHNESPPDNQPPSMGCSIKWKE